jgi:glycosyltransferase involved in cell wall biosynthesis
MWPESVVESGMVGHGRLRDAAESVLGAYCKWVYRESSIITVLSPGFKRLLVERGVPAEKIRIVYNWADDDAFHPMPRDTKLAEELGITPDKLNVVYAGNFGAFQGLEVLVRAASMLTDLPDVRIVLVGTGVDEPKLKALAAELRLPNIHLVARQPMSRMPAINALADVLVTHLKDLPFFQTTIPSKVQVGLASGRPAITAVRGDAADVMTQSGAGPVIAPDDPRAMADAIRSLHAIPAAQREALGERGRAYYMREMSLSVGADAMESIFASLARSSHHAKMTSAIAT